MGGSEIGLMANRNWQRRIYFPILLENTLVYGLHHIMVQFQNYISVIRNDLGLILR